MIETLGITHKPHLPKVHITINTIKWRSLSQSLLSQLLLLHSHLLLSELDLQLNPLLLSPLQMEEETTRRPVSTWTLRRCLICKSLFSYAVWLQHAWIDERFRVVVWMNYIWDTSICTRKCNYCINLLLLNSYHPTFHLLQMFFMIGSMLQITRKALMMLLRKWREARRSKLNIKLIYHGFISSLCSFLFVGVEKDGIRVPWDCTAS